MNKLEKRKENDYSSERNNEDFSREDSDRSHYPQSAKEKRPRKRLHNVNVEKVERISRNQNPENKAAADPHREPFTERRESGVRKSFNPNFDRDNRPVYKSSEQKKERGPYREQYAPRPDGDREPHRGPYTPKQDGDRGPHRGSYAPKQDRDFNRHTDYGQGSGRRPERDFNRHPSDRPPGRRSERDFNRDAGNTDYNRRTERDFNRHEPSKGYGYKQKPFGKPGGRPHAPSPRYDKDNYPRFAAPKADGPMRLNRFIAMSGICSRREADDYITAGVVTVNGKAVTELGSKIQPADEVRFNGEIIRGEKKVYIVMNKPKGYVTSVEDPHVDKTVMEFVKDACSERVYPVGRLDKNSVGVLLITNDGDLTKKLTHPSYRKKKVYQVTLDKQLSIGDMEQIAEGVVLEDGPIAPDAIDYVGNSRKEIGIEIHSGRNRIVRRIFESLGYHVMKLDRVYFAGLTKQKLKRGAWRFLTPKEVSILKSGEYE